MVSRVAALAVAFSVSAFALAGCSSSVAKPASGASSSPVPTVSAPAVEPAGPSNEELAEYFGAVAKTDPVELKRVAEELAAPNSNAYAYAIEQGAFAQAYQDGG